MQDNDRFEGAVLAAWFLPVVGNILWRPRLGLLQTAVFAIGLLWFLWGRLGGVFLGAGVMIATWIWSLVVLEKEYWRQQRKVAAHRMQT